MPGLEEIKGWYEGLQKTGKISDEKFKVLEEALAIPEVAAYIKDTTMMRSDYSRNMDGLTAKQKELEASEARVASLQQELIEWKGTNESKFQQTLTELEREKNIRSQLTNAVQVQLGIDPSTLIEGYTPLANSNGNGNGNGAGMLTQEQFNAALAQQEEKGRKQLQGIITDMHTWNSTVFRQSREAERLGITDYDPDKVWAEMARTNNWADPNAAFNTVFGAEEKRKAAAQADIQKQIDAAREEGATRARAEAALPANQRAVATDSYTQALIKGTPDESGQVGVVESREHVNRAAEALAERTGVPRRARA